jgi:hypothetical protein
MKLLNVAIIVQIDRHGFLIPFYSVFSFRSNTWNYNLSYYFTGSSLVNRIALLCFHLKIFSAGTTRGYLGILNWSG